MTRNPRAGRRAEVTARALELRAEGLTHKEVAARLGLSHSTVRSYISDPTGEAVAARKRSYSGVCEKCGGPTTGADGRAAAPTICADCGAQRQRESKYWTRERVIEAIQTWADEHGRPPAVADWCHASKDGSHPSATRVYRSRDRDSAPFASWADAIEAAGYQRPHVGRRTIKEGQVATQNRDGYVVLRETDEGWLIVGTSDRPNGMLALNELLPAVENGHVPEGRWVAVPGKYWRPRTLKPRTIFEFAEEPAEA